MFWTAYFLDKMFENSITDKPANRKTNAWRGRKLQTLINVKDTIKGTPIKIIVREKDEDEL